MSTRRISIAELKPGMFVVGLDRSWLETPFVRHHFLIKDQEDIARLKHAGVRTLSIDPTKGLDVEAATPAGMRPLEPEPTVAPIATETSHAGSLAEEMAAAGSVRDQARQALQRLFDGVKTGAPFDLSGLVQALDDLLTELVRHRTAMMLLAQISRMERSDRDPCAHALDVAVLSLALSLAHGFDMPTVKQLGLGALLHDVGELRLPPSLFEKAGAYTREERQLMMTHPRLGANLLARAGDAPETTRRIVVEHHERLDGSGYPSKLQGAQISLPSQIVGLVDEYDAMVSRRGNRPPLTARQAMVRVYEHERQTHYDRSVVERLIQCIGVYPIGTVVELNTGERGVVIAVNLEARLKPTVKVLADPVGQSYPTPWVVDLSTLAPSAPPRTITRALDDLPTDWRDLFVP